MRDPPYPPAGVIEATALESAAAAKSLDDLRERLSRFEGCGLKATATQLVFGDGNPALRMFMARPRRDEDRQGVPFVGRAGNCSTKCWRRSGLTGAKSILPMSCLGARPETARRRRLKRRPVCLHTPPNRAVDPKILVCLGAARRRPCSAAKTASCACADAGSPIERAIRTSGQSPCCIRRIFCASPRKKNWHGRICDACQGNQSLTDICESEWRERRDLNP